MYDIEKNVPFPEYKHHASKYGFRYMEVGDSFLFPSSETRGITSAASYFAFRNKDYKFSIRKVDQDNHRCWRVPVDKN